MKNDILLKICRQCKAACCRLGGSDVTKSEMNKILNNGQPNYFIKIGSNHYEMKSRKGVCPYLTKDYSCSIHKVRPLMCRCWPVDAEIEDNKKCFYINICPITHLFSDADIIKLKKKLSKVPDAILTCSISNSILSKNDIKLIEERYEKFKTKSLV
ncbi:YkgJ family cysteine cluster protein [Candidatus Falkowbacteria bacterium]|nr:YkgJ family cysteine cluster protein [Candidatus Falkowbacteria bacterium]